MSKVQPSDDGPRGSFRARWVARMGGPILALASTLLMLGGLELGLRAFWDGYYLKQTHGYAHPHPTRGWANIPGLDFVYGEPEFQVHVTHNSLGLRGPELEPPGPGRQRALMLGDSFAYGVGVEDDETLGAQLEKLAPSLQVLNAGVNGYGTGQELLVLEEEGPSLAPDLVLLTFFWNDVANNVERREHHFELVDGMLVRPPSRELPAVSAPAPPRRSWLRHSYLYRFASDALKMARFRLNLALGLPHEDGDRLPLEKQESAWAVERALLREIRTKVESLGSRLLIVIIPEQVQVQPDAHVLGLVETDYDVQKRLLDLGQREGIEVLDLLPALRKEYADRGEPLYYLRDRHLTARGTRLAAEQIQLRLQDLGWLPRG